MTKLRIFTAKLLLVAGIWLACFAVAPFNSCTNFTSPSLSVQNTDQVILRAEQAAEVAKATFNTFVHLERNNQALLEKFNPQIHVWAETIRKHGLDWIVSLRDATKTFKTTRTPENQANLNTALITLTKAVTETNKYIAEARKVSQP